MFSSGQKAACKILFFVRQFDFLVHSRIVDFRMGAADLFVTYISIVLSSPDISSILSPYLTGVMRKPAFEKS